MDNKGEDTSGGSSAQGLLPIGCVTLEVLAFLLAVSFATSCGFRSVNACVPTISFLMYVAFCMQRSLVSAVGLNAKPISTLNSKEQSSRNPELP